MKNQVSNPMQAQAPEDYPFSGTRAQIMLENAVNASGRSQREIAKDLNYKSSVVLSHMIAGRVPIPVDRAHDLAACLKMDPDAFLLAVLEQRHRGIDFNRLFNVTFTSTRTVARLESAAGCSLDDLPAETVAVLEEVVAARTPKRRWLTVLEAPVMDLIRRLCPKVSTEGLNETEQTAFERALGR